MVGLTLTFSLKSTVQRHFWIIYSQNTCSSRHTTCIPLTGIPHVKIKNIHTVLQKTHRSWWKESIGNSWEARLINLNNSSSVCTHSTIKKKLYMIDSEW